VNEKVPFGINLATGALAMVGATIVSALAFPERSAGLTIMALAVFGYTVLVDDIRAALAVAGIGYLLYDGFLVNRHGDLIWDGTTSLWAFAFALATGSVVRWTRHLRARAAVTVDHDVPWSRSDKKESHVA
jgi:hypothetical protein